MFSLFNKKKYLYRKDLLNLINTNKILEKKITSREISEMFSHIREIFMQNVFKIDEKFKMKSLRNQQKEKIEKILLDNNNNIEDTVKDAMLLFLEYLNADNKEQENNDEKEYLKKGVICQQEKDIILDLMKKIENYMNGHEFKKHLDKNITPEDKKTYEEIVDSIINDEELKESLRVECDFEIINKEYLEDSLENLTKDATCNYKMEPFARTASGGLYVALDNKKIGYIETYGSAGIVANNLKDFFSILANCGYLADLPQHVKNENDFIERYKSSSTCT